MDTNTGKQPHSRFRPLPRPSADTIPSVQQYADVIDLYNELLHEYRELDRRTSEREKRYREIKKSLKDWDEYIKRKRRPSGAVQDHEAQPVTPRVPNISPVSAVDTVTPKARLPDPFQKPPFLSHLREGAPPRGEARGERDHRTARSTSAHTASSSLRITSSQTTQGDLSSDGPQPLHDTEDVPVVVSTRSLKRKRDVTGDQAGGPNVLVRGGTPDRPVVIKEESDSRPIVNYRAQPHLLRTETSDLDAATGQGKSGFGCSLKSEDIDAPDKEQVVGDGEQTPRAVATKQQTTTTTPERHSSGPLQPLSNNTPTLPRLTNPIRASNWSGDKDQSHGAEAVHVLSEDGDVPPRSAKKTKLSTTTATPKTSRTDRLSHLLEGTAETPAKTVLSPRLASSLRKPREQADLQTLPSVHSNLHHPKSAVRKRPSPKRDHSPPPVLPEDEPLRSRPLHRLNINDFKVDPKYSELGYAYSETVRKREQRRCLPGCTKECCGAIRKMVAAGILPNVPRRRGLFDDSDADIDDDELTLQGYLGQAYAQVIRSATPEKKKEMLIEARAKAFADQHGKHRQAFERRTTPPGFWRTEMPTTQEEEEDREEARIMERQKVEERWREAMRGGGRYIFKDE